MGIVTFSRGTKFEVGVQNIIEIQARDKNGNNVTTGGEEFYVKIMDHWTTEGNFLWIATPGRRTILEKAIFEKMTDHGNGVYTYNFAIDRPGNFTIAPILYVKGESYAEYFHNTACSGTHEYSKFLQYLSQDWEGRDIFNGISKNVCIQFHFGLKPPVTGDYNFSFKVQDRAALKIGDSPTKSASLEKDKLYDWEIDYIQEGSQKSFMYFNWRGPELESAQVPMQNIYSPKYVSKSPIKAESICGIGFYEAQKSNFFIWESHCGDGIRAGSEECDDGNIIDGDGCSAICKVEPTWEWDFLEGQTKDLCTYCGDGIRWGTEEWDDGNIMNKDGCSSDCKIETIIWQCTGGSKTTADVCTYCGDGLVSGDEEWDDRNYKSGDGCSFDQCKKELTHDYKYYRSPDDKKDIFTYCGDGIRYGVEECDDGNNEKGDGWDDEWKIEDNWKCIYGSLNSRDYWIKWIAGFKFNENKLEWVVDDGHISILLTTYCLSFLLVLSFAMDISYACYF
jgi:cysteine-rich repeat protein